MISFKRDRTKHNTRNQKNPGFIRSDLEIHRFNLGVRVSEHVYLAVLQKATIIS